MRLLTNSTEFSRRLVMASRTPLSEVVVPVTQKVKTRKDPRRPYVGLEHLATNSPDLLGWAEADSSVSTNNVFSKGDILFGKLRPNLRKSVLAPFDGYCSTEILVLRALDGAEPDFAARLFQSEPVVAAAIRSAIGTRMPRTSWAALREVQVLSVPPQEQQAITRILDAVDGAIRNAELLVAKLRQLYAGLATDLLTQGIGNDGEIRHLKARPAEFKDSHVGHVPLEWEVAPLRQYGSTDRPYLKTGPFGSNLNQDHWVDVGVPVITIGSLGEGTFVDDDLLYVSERTARALRSYAVAPGDVVFSRVADVGRSVVVRDPQSGWIMSSNLMWLSVDQRRAMPDWLQANLAAHPKVRAQVRALVNAAGRDVANAAIINAVQFPWPSLSEQKRVVAALRAADARMRVEEAAAVKLRLLRQGLREVLLSGRVSVPLPGRDAR